MSTIALFHSALGVRPGVLDAAQRLRAAGHTVEIVDQYDGETFDDYQVAEAHIAAVGFPALMKQAVASVQHLPDGFIAAGFSNGGGMAEYVATQRPVSGVIMISGAMPLAMLGHPGWPSGVRAQIHYTTGDPFRNQEWIGALVGEIRVSNAPLEVFDYAGDGHLFTDASLPSEYDAASAAAMWERVQAFCAQPVQRAL